MEKTFAATWGIAFPILVFISGLLVGGGTVEYEHRQHDQRSLAFQQKVRCEVAADHYAKANTSEIRDTILDRVDYSDTKNTCFGAFTAMNTVGASRWEDFELVDLISGEKTRIGTCDLKTDCSQLSERLDVLFKNAIAGTMPPPSKIVTIQ